MCVCIADSLRYHWISHGYGCYHRGKRENEFGFGNPGRNSNRRSSRYLNYILYLIMIKMINRYDRQVQCKKSII